ncbi:MAG: hypothetical protein J0M29_09000 [Chitinophagales bacterium]|nr:hypothetical protein [Chitinophagales bacterium]
MQTTEKILSPLESLQVIRETIDIAKRTFRDNGFHFLLWGWLVAIASLVHWYLATNNLHEHPEMAWGIMVIIGMPAAIIREWRREKNKREPNVFSQWYNMIWLGFGISMILAITLAVKNHLSPTPFILILMGFATFMSGIMLKFRPLIFGAIVIWAGALWCLFLSDVQHLLVQGACAIFGYLLPGYLLNQEVKKGHVPGA